MHYKSSWVNEVALRRKSASKVASRRKGARNLDQTLASFEIKRLTYEFGALDRGGRAEARALEIMRVVQQFARDFRYEVKELCIQFVYDTTRWLYVSAPSDQFVSHQTSILEECIPIGIGGLVAPSREPLTRHETLLLEHSINVAGEIAYDVCKYLRVRELAESAIMLLYELLLFTDLNRLGSLKDKVLHKFSECERICKEPLRQGHPFKEGLELLHSWRKTALENAKAARFESNAN